MSHIRPVPGPRPSVWSASIEIIPDTDLGTGHADSGRGWCPEQLWLWPDLDDPDVRSCIRAVVEQTLSVAVPCEVEEPGFVLLAALHRTGQVASRLRLAARLLRGGTPGDETPRSRDLAACCLLAAAVEHGDLLAAVEFAALAQRRALLIEIEVEDRTLPPGLGTAGRLASRMRRQASAVLARRFSLPPREGIVSLLARAALSDPIAGYLEYSASTARDRDFRAGRDPVS